MDERKIIIEAVRAAFADVEGVLAVFVVFGRDLCLLYSVVDEFSEIVTSNIIAAEELLEHQLPQFKFDFRTRAAQGRDCKTVVPDSAILIYRGDCTKIR